GKSALAAKLPTPKTPTPKAMNLGSWTQVVGSCLVLTFDGRLFCLVGADAQRTEEALVIRRQLERAARRQQARRRGDLGHGRAIVAVHEPHDGLERHLHVESGF